MTRKSSDLADNVGKYFAEPRTSLDQAAITYDPAMTTDETLWQLTMIHNNWTEYAPTVQRASLLQALWEIEKLSAQLNRHTAPDLLAACKAQHNAIDTLFARLIEADPTFMPSKSGVCWDACLAGNAAIAKATEE